MKLQVLCDNAPSHTNGLTGQLSQDIWRSLTEFNFISGIPSCYPCIGGVVPQECQEVVGKRKLLSLISDKSACTLTQMEPGLYQCMLHIHPLNSVEVGIVVALL